MKPKGMEKWIVCRICLQQPSTGLQPIFDHSEEKDLTEMILECGGVPIKKYDHYPDKICTKCFKYLKVAHKFRVTCQRSHKHLSRFIAPVVVDPEEQDRTEQLIALEDDDGIEELELKVEPKDVKQEFSDGEEIVDVFNALDDSNEFVYLESINEEVGNEDAEYLDEIEQELLDADDDEYLPHRKTSPRKYVKRKTMERGIRNMYVKKEKPKKSTAKSKAQKETSFICDVCGNIYPSKGRLNEHIKLHRGIKPYDCEICGHRFAQTQQLSRHMNTHTGQRPFKCNYCPAAFADLSTRNKHHRIHTNERPYCCDTCGKTFTYTNTLKIHKMIHTGEKPHVCEVCGKGFPQSYKLRNHMLTHEKKPVQETKVYVESMEEDDDEHHDSIQLLEM